MADQTTNIILRVRDEATAGINKIRGAYAAFTVGIGAVTAALGFSVKAAAEQERVLAQMDAVLESTKNSVGLTKQEIVEYAEALMRSTGIADDVIETGQNMLLTFTNIKGEAFKGATQAAIDMTAAFNGGEVSAEALSATSVQVGKALNDPINGLTALRRVGVTFTEQQKEQIAVMQQTGDVAGAQAVILQELSREFGGSAAAAAGTFSGSLRALQTRFGEIGESVGKILIPVLSVLTSALGLAIGPLERFLSTERVARWTAALQTGFENVTYGVQKTIVGAEKLSSSIEYYTKLASLKTLGVFSDQSSKISALQSARVAEVEELSRREIEIQSRHSENVKKIKSAETNSARVNLNRQLSDFSDTQARMTAASASESSKRLKKTAEDTDRQRQLEAESAQKLRDIVAETGVEMVDLWKKNQEAQERSLSESLNEARGFFQDFERTAERSVSKALFDPGGAASQIQQGLAKIVGEDAAKFIAGGLGNTIVSGFTSIISGLFGGGSRGKTVQEYAQEAFEKMVENTNRVLDDIGRQKSTTEKQLDLLEKLGSQLGDSAIIPERFLPALGLGSGATVQSGKQEILGRLGVVNNADVQLKQDELQRAYAERAAIEQERKIAERGLFGGRPAQGLAGRSDSSEALTKLSNLLIRDEAQKLLIKKLESELGPQSDFSLQEAIDFVDLQSKFSKVGVTPAFAAGGVVPGNATSGDRVQIRANSGEMVLTKSDQANLLNLIRGGGTSAPTVISIQLDRRELARAIVDLTNLSRVGLV